MAGRIDRLCFVVVAGDFESDRLAEHIFEGRDVSICGPQLELGVARRAQAGQVVVAPGIEVDARQRLGVAAVETFGEAHHGREPLDRLAQRSLQLGVPVV